MGCSQILGRYLRSMVPSLSSTSGRENPKDAPHVISALVDYVLVLMGHTMMSRPHHPALGE